MLDDENHIKELDRSNAFGVIAGQPGQLRQQFEVDLGGFKPSSVLMAGMGGSALAGEFLRSWLGDRLPVPLTITRGYDLPGFVGKETLVVISSYSGNTEETLACLEQALKAGARVVVMTAGGKLEEAAMAEGLPLLKVPGGFQPRMAVLYGVKALAVLLTAAGLVSGLSEELEEAADWAEKQISSWAVDSPTDNNKAKQMAEKLQGKAPVVYAGPTLSFLAHKWKIDINENAKNVAFYYQWPEFNHNEFIGWTHGGDKVLAVIELRSQLDGDRLAERFDISNRLLSGKMPQPLEVTAEGDTKLKQMLWTLQLGGFTSLYLALLNNEDPTPVDLVERLKKELDK